MSMATIKQVDDQYRPKRIHIDFHRYIVRSQAIHTKHPDMNDTPDFDEIFKALAHPVRRDILRWLKDPERFFEEQEHQPFDIGVCAGKIDQRTGLSQSTVSAHLATLQRAGLVTSRKVGQWHFFRRNEETIQAYVRHLSEAL